MSHEPVLITQRMRTPRAAAIAGIVFSLLLITSMLLIWTSVPADPRGPAADVISHLKAISFSYNCCLSPEWRSCGLSPSCATA
jgi:hypothetical protein